MTFHCLILYMDWLIYYFKMSLIINLQTFKNLFKSNSVITSKICFYYNVIKIRCLLYFFLFFLWWWYTDIYQHSVWGNIMSSVTVQSYVWGNIMSSVTVQSYARQLNILTNQTTSFALLKCVFLVFDFNTPNTKFRGKGSIMVSKCLLVW